MAGEIRPTLVVRRKPCEIGFCIVSTGVLPLGSWTILRTCLSSCLEPLNRDGSLVCYYIMSYPLTQLGSRGIINLTDPLSLFAAEGRR